MTEHLRERILRKLETLSDERLYQVLDYVEFLEARYAEKPAESSVFTRFAEAVEDRLRQGRLSATAVAETMNLMNRAMNVLGGVASAGKTVATDLVDVARQAARSTGSGAPDGAGVGSQQPGAAQGAAQATATAAAPGPSDSTPPPGAQPPGTNPPPGDTRS